MVSAPYPPGSSTSISPPSTVFEMAPAKVLHGAVRLQGLASSPTPETQVRDACAATSVLITSKKATVKKAVLAFMECSRVRLQPPVVGSGPSVRTGRSRNTVNLKSRNENTATTGRQTACATNGPAPSASTVLKSARLKK